MTRQHPAQQGFTLLEILVALAIMAMAVVVVLQLFSANLQGLAASDDYVKAVIRAEAKMREILDDSDLAQRSWSEVSDDGYRIDASVSPVAGERTENLPVQLLRISLTVHWTKGVRERTLTLGTMKLVNRRV